MERDGIGTSDSVGKIINSILAKTSVLETHNIGVKEQLLIQLQR
jgi:hypothetical protein